MKEIVEEGYDITAEFAEWAKRKSLPMPDDEEDEYYDMWALFLDEEYNTQACEATGRK